MLSALDVPICLLLLLLVAFASPLNGLLPSLITQSEGFGRDKSSKSYQSISKIEDEIPIPFYHCSSYLMHIKMKLLSSCFSMLFAIFFFSFDNRISSRRIISHLSLFLSLMEFSIIETSSMHTILKIFSFNILIARIP